MSGSKTYGIAVPTQDMYLYAARASVGDDVYHEPCTKALEAHMAKITGKEAALFVPSGTMSNQIALRTHLKQPPYAVLCDHRAHIVRYVVGLYRNFGCFSDGYVGMKLVAWPSTLAHTRRWWCPPTVSIQSQNHYLLCVISDISQVIT